MRRFYSPEEDDILRQCYAKGIGPKRISYEFLPARSARSISQRIQRLNWADAKIVRAVHCSMTFAVSFEQRQLIQHTAHANGKSVSTFVRNMVLAQCPK